MSAELAPGKYEVAVMGVAYGEDRRAARLRVARSEGELEAGTKVVYTPSGFGDGTFTVFELRAAGELVGLEVEFIAPETPYPFE